MSTQPARDARTQLHGIDAMAAALRGATVTDVEFIQGETEDADALVLKLGAVTLYASAPDVYTDAELRAEAEHYYADAAYRESLPWSEQPS